MAEDFSRSTHECDVIAAQLFVMNSLRRNWQYGAGSNGAGSMHGTDIQGAVFGMQPGTAAKVPTFTRLAVRIARSNKACVFVNKCSL